MQRIPLLPWLEPVRGVGGAGGVEEVWVFPPSPWHTHTHIHTHSNTQAPFVILCVSVMGELVSRILGWLLKLFGLLVLLHARLALRSTKWTLHLFSPVLSGSAAAITHISFSWGGFPSGWELTSVVPVNKGAEQRPTEGALSKEFEGPDTLFFTNSWISSSLSGSSGYLPLYESLPWWEIG